MSHAHGVEVLGAEATKSESTDTPAGPNGSRRLFENIKSKITASRPEPESMKLSARSTASLACGIAGAVMWKKHWLLGYLAGSSIGGNSVRIIGGDLSAFGDMASTGAGVYGSLSWKKHPALGYIGGHILGDMAVSSVQTAVEMA